ncbi:hypothetical protein PMAYCL1PPCAC_26894, partial [Pristionchus mayeri]
LFCPSTGKSRSVVQLFKEKSMNDNGNVVNCEPLGAKFTLMDEEKKLFECSECGKQMTKKSIDYHKRIHSGEKPYACPYCVYSARGMTSLYTHIRMVHSIKPFTCITCDARFYRQPDLKEHVANNPGHQASLKRPWESRGGEGPIDDQPGPSRKF